MTADEILVDWARDLIWLRDGVRLALVDLREVQPKPHAIAVGLREGLPLKLVLKRGDDEHWVDRPLACDTETLISLSWEEEPAIEDVGVKTQQIQLVGRQWLKDNVKRVAGPETAFDDFWLAGGDVRTALPRRLRRCDDPDDCGRSLKFGNKGWLLVLTRAHQGEDCRQFSCVLFDPARKMYASPDDPATWGTAAKVRPGSCGPFPFDVSGEWYLSQGKLCSLSGTCRDIGGKAIGWLPPGAWIGAPG